MLVDDLLNNSAPIDSRSWFTIKTECSQFLNESGGLPVFRVLPKSYDTFQRVKVRHHNRSDIVTRAFNTAFQNQAHNIIPRGIFTQSVITESTATHEPFYVFPINGYKFFYSKGVQNSNLNFRDVISTLQENIDGAFEITTDLIKYTYTQKNLIEGITSDSEIMFYGIPYFYAVRAGDVDNYTRLINR
jgi:hypothetical protein